MDEKKGNKRGAGRRREEADFNVVNISISNSKSNTKTPRLCLKSQEKKGKFPNLT